MASLAECLPPYPDAFDETRPGVRDDNFKIKILTSKWDLAHNYVFPKRYQAGCFRKLNHKWLAENSWLRYSISKDGVYCGPCNIFNKENKNLVSTPHTDWSNMSKALAGHRASSSHTGALEAAENFVAIIEGRQKDILSSMSTSYNTLVERNRHILIAIVDTIVLCGKQNIALRGHTDKDGNFRALLNFQAKHNPVLKDHLEKGDPCTKYTSPQIQNELIEICGCMILEDIIAACNRAPCYGFIADEATDVATIEQMALCVRYYDAASRSLREDFLGFAECKSTTGAALTDAFLEKLRSLGVRLEQMRGQGYDGAANMSGRFRGVQARVQEQYPQALYTHCKAHNLNLAIIHASKENYARNMMDLVQTIAFAFNYSGKRMLCFRDNLTDDALSREDMEKRTKLQSLCETRWAARADALYTFLSAFTTVEAALLELSTEHGDTKAATYRQGILVFDFMITLVAVEHVLRGLVPLSKMLQREGCDLVQASTEAKVLVSMLEAERNDEEVWHSLYDKAVDLAGRVGVEATLPRHVARQQNRPNAPAANPSDFWKRNMYLPFLDHLLSELRNRLLQAHGRFLAQYFIPDQTRDLTQDVVRQIHDEYSADLVEDFNVFNDEVGRWKTKWTTGVQVHKPSTLEEAIQYASVDLYPNIRMCMSVLLAMPVSTATAERSFSTMRRIKTYLRNTMSTERLSGLGLLNIYREKEIASEMVVDNFARKKERRLALIFRA